MTDYLLPEDDRIAGYVNPLLENFADLEPDAAEYVGLGAVTVIGLIQESVFDLSTRVVASAATQGVSREEAEAHFNVVFEQFYSILQPRLDVMRLALMSTQEEEEEEDPTEALLAALAEALGIDLSDFDGIEVVEVEDDEDEPVAEWERELLDL